MTPFYAIRGRRIITITNDIHNLGEVSAENTIVSFFYDNVKRDTRGPGSVAPGSKKQVQFTVNNLTSGWHNITIKVDGGTPCDVDDANNSLSRNFYVTPEYDLELTKILPDGDCVEENSQQIIGVSVIIF